MKQKNSHIYIKYELILREKIRENYKINIFSYTTT